MINKMREQDRIFSMTVNKADNLYIKELCASADFVFTSCYAFFGHIYIYFYIMFMSVKEISEEIFFEKNRTGVKNSTGIRVGDNAVIVYRQHGVQSTAGRYTYFGTIADDRVKRSFCFH